MIERKQEAYLKKWHDQKKRKPLILRGARQVGKSTLVKNFCKKNNLILHEINFEIVSLQSLKIIEGLDIELVLQEIEVKTKRAFEVSTSVIFFDEIQANVVAIQALRYFFEHEKNIAIVAAGSLLEFTLDDHEYSMPVGRIEYLHMGPLTFYEFLKATGEDILWGHLKQKNFKIISSSSDLLQKKLREYYFVGGMPEAVATYVRSGSLLEVSKVHSSILQTYKSDFGKYKTRVAFDQLAKVFDLLPNALGKKVKHGGFFAEEKSRTVAKVLDLFIKAKILIKCEHTNATGLPLSALVDSSVYKLYFLDIGLLHYAQGLNGEDFFNSSNSTKFITEGTSAEQFVAQHLAYAGHSFDEPRLYYWLRDKSNQKAEIDFVFNIGKNIIPVEVKSGKSGKFKSLFYFMEKTNYSYAIHLGILEKELDFQVRKTKSNFYLHSIPLWMVEDIYSFAQEGISKI
jgi:predicted AAA+ superfamily ATPase